MKPGSLERLGLMMTEMNEMRMDLKVCEGCGTLWLRSRTAAGVYCRRCTVHLAEYPAPRVKRVGARRTQLARVTPAAHAASVGGAR